jgi:hypothetical protein
LTNRGRLRADWCYKHNSHALLAFLISEGSFTWHEAGNEFTLPPE